MSTLPYLNLGCGQHYHPNWVNVDFAKTGDGVIGHNLLKGIPFDENTFEVVYHSHVLEHFPKDKAALFINECYRVLKPGGIIRIAIPDLEQIIGHYIRLLALARTDTPNEKIRADYDWIMIELYDQTVRNQGGGEMLKYLAAETLNNEDFVFERIGHEGRMIRKGMIEPPKKKVKVSVARRIYRIIRRTISPKNIRGSLFKTLFKKEYDLAQLGGFRQSGEIHQWMYDSYSLGNLLRDAGFKNITKMDFDKSNVSAWRSFELDEVDHAIRKPDSLFVEAIK